MFEPDPRIFQILSDQIKEVNEIHDLYNSPHEGYAIIREEQLEVGEEYNRVKEVMKELDQQIRHDDTKEKQLYSVISMRDYALNSLMEMFDLMVTLDRYIISAVSNRGEFLRSPQDDDTLNDIIDRMLDQYLVEENVTAHECLKKARKEEE